MRQVKLPDDAFVVRGGKSTPVLIKRAIASFSSGITGIAARSAPIETIESLAQTIPHNIIRTTTVAEFRSAGGDVIPYQGSGPFFAIVIGWNKLHTDRCSDENSEVDQRKPDHGFRIFADFNNVDSLGRVRLNTRGTLDDMATLRLTFCDGMNVVLDDGEEFFIPGIVRYCKQEGWVAEVDWEAIRKR